MRKLGTVAVLAMFSALVIIAVPIFGVTAQETLLWEADVPSTGAPVSSPVLEAGREYRIVAKGAFASWILGTVVKEYSADAQYYNPNPPDWWIWDPINTFPAPDGHSFLQINGIDVIWGPFNNGDASGLGHEYTTYYTGTGALITFAIVDWIDGDYVDNSCHIHVKIYEGPPAPPEAETAYAYDDEYATCFKHWGFKNWGWSNGPLEPDHYEFDIYAGAAKCNINKGTLVGTLTIDYDGSTATVTYTMDAGWMMQRTQLYMDGEPLPRDAKSEYTVSPGQYPYIHDPVVDPASDTHTVTGLSGNIYVVAHADVFEV